MSEPSLRVVKNTFINYFIRYCELDFSDYYQHQHLSTQEAQTWSLMSDQEKRQELRSLGERLVLMARAEGNASDHLVSFLKHGTTNHHRALLREIDALKSPDIGRACRWLKNHLACKTNQPQQGTWAGKGARERMREEKKCFTNKERDVLIKAYSQRIFAYAHAIGIDASPLALYLSDSKKVNLSELFAFLESVDQHQASSPEVQIFCGLFIMLHWGNTVVHLARQKDVDDYRGKQRSEYAQDSYRQFLLAWQQIKALPDHRQWKHLQAWQELMKLNAKFAECVASIDGWTESWAKLQEALQEVEPLPVERFERTLKENLRRLQEGDAGDGMNTIQALLPKGRSFKHNDLGLTNVSIPSPPIPKPPDAGEVHDNPRDDSPLKDEILSATEACLGGAVVKICHSNGHVSMSLLRIMVNREETSFDELCGQGKLWKQRVDETIRNAVNRLNARLGQYCTWKLITKDGWIKKIPSVSSRGAG